MGMIFEFKDASAMAPFVFQIMPYYKLRHFIKSNCSPQKLKVHDQLTLMSLSSRQISSHLIKCFVSNVNQKLSSWMFQNDLRGPSWWWTSLESWSWLELLDQLLMIYWSFISDKASVETNDFFVSSLFKNKHAYFSNVSEWISIADSFSRIKIFFISWKSNL